MNSEESLSGGAINTVTRRGNTVYRTGGPWVAAVHSVLNHLHDAGFRWAPRALGVDATDREMIGWLPGESMMRPWKPVMFTDGALEQAATVLRALHDATRDLVLPPETVWRPGAVAKATGQVVRHGDLGPWNTLWQKDDLTGLIDWDFAEPGEAITDLAQMALYWIPLRGEDHWRECGFPQRPDFRRRLSVFCAAYGDTSPVAVTNEIERLQVTEMGRIETFANEGQYPWTMFRENGEIERTRQEVEWLRTIMSDASYDCAATIQEGGPMANTDISRDSLTIGTPVIGFDGEPLGTIREVQSHYFLVGQEESRKDLEISVRAITKFEDGVLHVSVIRKSATEVDA